VVYRVVFTDNVPESLDVERDVLDGIGAVVVDGESARAPIEEVVADADAVITSHQLVDGDFLDRMPNCRVVSRTGIGVDYVDLDAATERGVVVTNVPDYCIPEVTDHALALMLAVQRRIVAYDAEVRRGIWERASKPITRIDGQVLGLVAFGNTAREFGRKAQALGMEVLTYAPSMDPAVVSGYGATRVGLDELLERSDVVSIHTPLTTETAGMLGRAELSAMKESAVLINTARGGVVDQAALVEALAAGEIAGAGLDVLEEEPPASDDPILAHPSVVLTPHVGYFSEESRRELRRRAVENVRTVLEGGVVETVVNEAVLRTENA
jgi:D-3-phosphoglycerate dehydrogenase